MWVGWLVSETPGLTVSVSALLGLQMRTVMPGFYMDAGDLNFGPSACTASTLPTELSPQFRVLVFHTRSQKGRDMSVVLTGEFQVPDGTRHMLELTVTYSVNRLDELDFVGSSTGLTFF